MSPYEFLGNVTVIAALMALISLVEIVVPLYARGRTERARAPANLALAALLFGANWVLSTATPAIAGEGGFLAHSSLPAWALVSLSVIVLDFFTYVAHLAMHKFPLLWRMHRVHHSDPFLDVTTSFRTHPLEVLWRFLWTAVPALALGLPAQGIVAYRFVSAVNALLEHANIAVPRRLDRGVSWLWVTPNMHKIHHSTVRHQTDSNYGNILSLFDRVFRTFTPTDRAFDLTYGLDDFDRERATSLRNLLRAPFEGAVVRAPGRMARSHAVIRTR